MSNGDTGSGYFRYDACRQAIRTDFYSMCPFLRLYQTNVDANALPCSVRFYQENNDQVYPLAHICCNYTFPA
jgi:hypothetical protein